MQKNDQRKRTNCTLHIRKTEKREDREEETEKRQRKKEDGEGERKRKGRNIIKKIYVYTKSIITPLKPQRNILNILQLRTPGIMGL